MHNTKIVKFTALWIWL